MVAWFPLISIDGFDQHPSPPPVFRKKKETYPLDLASSFKKYLIYTHKFYFRALLLFKRMHQYCGTDFNEMICNSHPYLRKKIILEGITLQRDFITESAIFFQ